MPAAPIDPRILEEAAEWLVQLHGGHVTQAQRQACAQWQRTSPEHQRAWGRAELLMGTLGGLPPALARPALARARGSDRRVALGKIAALLATVPAGLAAWHLSGNEGWRADHRTATGERREVVLADGSRITLNTGSAFDVKFDGSRRVVELRAGEILVQTSPDPSPVHRPFSVCTPQGSLEALGTRFVVRLQDARTHLAVLDGAVRVVPRQGAEPPVVRAGQALSFDARSAGDVVPADAGDSAWAQGMLLAYRMPMAQFVAELSRYRRGLLACDPAVASLPVTGSYPIDDPDRALRMLVATYAVDATTRLGGYWVTIVPRRRD